MTITANRVDVRAQERATPSNALLYLAVFVGGVSSIGIEITASRLIAPYFGSSTIIWATVIGLTLLYLSLGYYIGGKLADRYPSERFFYSTFVVSALGTAIIPILSRPILNASLSAFNNLNVGAFYGALIGILVLFIVPITVLGCVSPLALRLRLRGVEEVGGTAGALYALSTVGSIVGSFLPVIVLTPYLGTRWTFYIFAIALGLMGLIGLLRGRNLRSIGTTVAVLVLVLALALFGPNGNLRQAEAGQLLYEGESEYNYIQVVRNGDEVGLVLNDGHAIHSIYNPNQLLTEGPWDYFMMGPFFNLNQQPADVRSLALIGLAVQIDGVEIDPEIVKIGREYFNMNEPNLNVIVEDGRYFLRTTTKTYDVIGVDAYRQPYIPFQLTTKEFFQESADHLNDNGVMILNAGRFGTDYRLVNAVASTMRAVFPNVYLIDVGRFSNTMVIATKKPTQIANYAANIAKLPQGSPLRTIGDLSLSTGNVREWTGNDMVFTDDHAPIEFVIDRLIVDAARKETEGR
jgi:predicted membrane-bound spermidine synthase